LQIANSGIEAVLPDKVISKKISFKHNLLQVGKKVFSIDAKLFVVGAGKASALMAKAIEEIISPTKINDGIVISNTTLKTKKIKIIKASHPIPNFSGLNGAKKILHLTENLNKKDTVINLLSGGGSALFTLPVERVLFKDLQLLTKQLIEGGVEVYEIQKIRKHLSKIKGGRFAQHLYPSQVISLVISDVINPKDIVAAGPLEPDQSTFKEAILILKKYKLWSKASQNIKKHLKQGAIGKISETPKKNSFVFKNVRTFTLANNKIALEEMAKQAKLLGYKPIIRESPLLGNVLVASKKISKEITNLAKNNQFPIAYIYSSELVIKVNGQGKGGRCQEHAARIAEKLRGNFNYTFLSIGSDGVDYLEGIRGAAVNQDTYQQWSNKKIDISKHLSDNNSHFLHKISNTLVRGGKTGTNVGDINICLLDK